MINDDRSAKGVLDKQHERLRNQAEAIIQSVGWIRKEDRLEGEIRLEESARRFLDGHNIVDIGSDIRSDVSDADLLLGGIDGREERKTMGREIGERDRAKEEGKTG